MKRLILFFIVLFLLSSCQINDEGKFYFHEFTEYKNRYESICTIFPGEDGCLTIKEWKNVKHKDIHIHDGYMTFPDSTGSYVTLYNCPTIITVQ